MAQTGYTPIQIYSSSTGGAAPSAGNLTNSTLGSELAINITDGKLFYKDNAGAVQVIAWKTTPTTAGGTGLTSYTAGDLLYYATGTTLSKLGIGTSTTVLTSSGTAPQWTAQSALSVGEAANLKSNATTGVMQITGPATGTTRVMTIPNANFTVARTDATQNFNGSQFFNSPDTTKQIAIIAGNSTNQILGDYASGSNIPLQIGIYGIPAMLTFETSGDVTVKNNLVIGTSGKGIDFSATPGTGTSELLADYEEGTFTPTIVYSGTNTPTYITQLGRYTKIGRIVEIQIYLSWNENGSTGNVTVGALPFTSVTSSARAVPSVLSFGLTGLPTNVSVTGFVNSNATTIFLCLNDNAATTLSATYTDNDQDLYLTVTYEAA